MAWGRSVSFRTHRPQSFLILWWKKSGIDNIMLVVRKVNWQPRVIRLMWKSCFCSTRCVVPLGSRLLGERFRGADHDYIACITTFSIILLTTFNFYSKLGIQINQHIYSEQACTVKIGLYLTVCNSRFWFPFSLTLEWLHFKYLFCMCIS